MQVLFKNCNIINLEDSTVTLSDILVENGHIKAVEEVGRMFLDKENEVDIQGNFVMQPFYNAYCNSKSAVEENYGLEFISDTNLDAILLQSKNVLSGVAFLNDISNKTSENCYLEKIDLLTDKDLDDVCMNVSQKKQKLFIKVGQTLDELGSIDKNFNKSVSRVLEDFGLLDKNPIIIGGNCLEKDELQLLSEFDCKFVITPFEDGKNGRRPTNLITLKTLGFEVGIGSGNSTEIDFFAYMRQILMNMRGMFEECDVLTEQEVLQMATVNGAKILSKEVCSFKVGQPADFVVIKKEDSLYDDIFKTLVWEKSKKDVLMTIVDGKICQKNGEILMKNVGSYDKIRQDIKLTTRRKQKNDD